MRFGPEPARMIGDRVSRRNELSIATTRSYASSVARVGRVVDEVNMKRSTLMLGSLVVAVWSGCASDENDDNSGRPGGPGGSAGFAASGSGGKSGGALGAGGTLAGTSGSGGSSAGTSGSGGSSAGAPGTGGSGGSSGSGGSGGSSGGAGPCNQADEGMTCGPSMTCRCCNSQCYCGLDCTEDGVCEAHRDDLRCASPGFCAPDGFCS